MRFSSLLIIVTLLMLISCQVQKRRYQKGYYVNQPFKSSTVNKSKISTVQNKAIAPAKESEKLVPVISGNMPAIAAAENPKSAKHNANNLYTTLPATDSCDVLVFKDGSELSVKVLEVNQKDIKYKRCDNMDGPTYLTVKKDLFLIKFRNGTRELIKDEPTVVYQSNPSPQFPSLNKKKVVHPLAPFALLTGILSIVLPYASVFFVTAFSSFNFVAFLFVAALLLSLSAIAIGKKAIREINERPEVYRGKGLAMPGMIMGIVMLSLIVLIAIVVILILLSL